MPSSDRHLRYSDNCPDVVTYWSRGLNKCIPCEMSRIKPGFEFTPNCGFEDNGGRRESTIKKCRVKFFNDGTWTTCRPCSSCPPAAGPCDGTADTQCQARERNEENNITARDVHPRRASTVWPIGRRTILKTTAESSGPYTDREPGPLGLEQCLAPIIFLVCIMVGVFSYFIYKSRRQCFKGPQAQTAPLRMVLDDMDVLDELIILLDPEGSGVKSTRHLASYCSFPSTWINYTYSMRDSKSPLKSVLEGVTTKHPDWTVGHLGQMLREMGRNDAVIVLAKLRLNKDIV